MYFLWRIGENNGTFKFLADLFQKYLLCSAQSCYWELSIHTDWISKLGLMLQVLLGSFYLQYKWNHTSVNTWTAKNPVSVKKCSQKNKRMTCKYGLSTSKSCGIYKSVFKEMSFPLDFIIFPSNTIRVSIKTPSRTFNLVPKCWSWVNLLDAKYMCHIGHKPKTFFFLNCLFQSSYLQYLR